jgi:hypothetical protein
MTKALVESPDEHEGGFGPLCNPVSPVVDSRVVYIAASA